MWWLALLVLAPGSVDADVSASGIDTRGLSLVVGRAARAPSYALAPTTPRAPASNMKILTAGAALARLGADFRFVTRFVKTPDGDLVVVGDGDPSWSGRFFDGDPTAVMRRVAADLKSRGVVTVRNVVLDASRFDDVVVHADWPADQLERWYCAPVAGLVYNDSCWDVTVRPGARAGAAALVEISPSLLRPGLVNRCETAAGGRGQIVHVGRANGGALTVRGRVLKTSRGVTANLTVVDPVRFFGGALKAALEREGVVVTGRVRTGRAPAGAATVLFVRSRLRRALGVMLTNSQNLYAECIFKRLGVGTFGDAGRVGAAALARNGVDIGGLEWRDGSGLAHTNRVTARTLYDVLQRWRDEPAFVEALAAGGTGTLRKRYRELGDRVRAKTGTIRGVSALSGYVTGRRGGRHVFVILCTGRSRARARALQDRIVARLSREP